MFRSLTNYRILDSSIERVTGGLQGQFPELGSGGPRVESPQILRFRTLVIMVCSVCVLGELLENSCRAEVDTQLPTVQDALYSGTIGSQRGGRTSLPVDPILHQLVVGRMTAPQEGGISGRSFRGQEQHWQKIEIAPNGAIQEELRGGYLYFTFTTDKAETFIFEPNGISDVYVNGVPRVGDVYGKGWVLLPVQLRAGLNEFWCKLGRGKNRSLKLSRPQKSISLTTADATLPDLLTNENGKKWAAIRIVNATPLTAENLRFRAQISGSETDSPISCAIPPMTVQKIPFQLLDTSTEPGEQTARIHLLQGDQLLDEQELTFEVKEPSRNYRRTFLSAIDGSVQYYGVREGNVPEGEKPAMFLSVHGAGVKAIGQAGSYKNKDWGYVVAPTNRREFGFDWEDWGRLDAMEVLAHAESHFHTDPERTYLTGHSMGGHGTWQLGATFPSRWAAIAPIAGWRSFFSYAGGREQEASGPVAEVMNRAMNPSRTLELSRNYLNEGVYIEHGENDDNVPVSEARFMRKHLAAFHPDFAYLEEPGAGHWYGVDHANLFEYFRWHKKKDVRDIETLEFRTACPGISSQSFYFTLYQQLEPFKFSGVVSKQSIRTRRQRRQGEEIARRSFDIATENLAVCKIDLSHCLGFEEITMQLDEQTIENLPMPVPEFLWLKKVDGKWQIIEQPDNPMEKNPNRYGGFKDAFRHQMVFVYSTAGTETENQLTYDKARFDAETFYYRGNGSIEVIPDSQFTLEDYKDRSVVLYGNASTNTAWELLLSDCPVRVERGAVTVGDRKLEGDDLGIYMVRPRTDSSVASVGVVAGTAETGLRTVFPNRYFIAGTGYPDLMIFKPEIYSRGLEGIEVAGYFDNNWEVDEQSLAWKQD